METSQIDFIFTLTQSIVFALNDYSLNTVQNTHHRGGRIAVRLVCSEVVEFKLVKLETGRRHSDTSPNCECSLLTGS